jgi:GAF domain-containing protein
MLEKGLPGHKILAHLVNAAETISGGGSVSSILVLDKDGLLRNGASPRLPYDYLTAIDGLKPHPNVGTCAAAAATGSMVITSDFRDDDKWAELRHLPLALGFTCAWSLPIKNDSGKVLGTFGTYFREKRKPSQEEIEAVDFLAHGAARVLNYHQ